MSVPKPAASHASPAVNGVNGSFGHVARSVIALTA